MAGHIKDRSGSTFGELYVVSLKELKNHRTYYNCKCSCGKDTVASVSSLVAGDTKSCGHLREEHLKYLWKINSNSTQKIEAGLKVSPTTLRRYFMNKFENKCQRCGWSEVNIYSNTIPLQLHHIDGNSDNGSLDNLELLCPNCHALTSNFNGLNMFKSARINRRKSFKDINNAL